MALCKESGLVGGLYAPSLMIGAAVGAVFGGSTAELINSAIPGNAAIAEPQAYALGAVGLAIWVPSVANQSKETEGSDARGFTRDYSILSPIDKFENWRQTGDANDFELCIMGPDDNHEAIEDIILEDLKVSQAMLTNYLKVQLSSTIKEVVQCMEDGQQTCVLVVDPEEHLEGILTYGDIKCAMSKNYDEVSEGGVSSTPDLREFAVFSVCTRGIRYRGRKRGLLTCYPDTDLAIAKMLMEAKGIKQLPVAVVERAFDFQEERKRCYFVLLFSLEVSQHLRVAQRGAESQGNPKV
ncbi:Chloride channel, core [Cynara cardunculus var. scolymus]|uniref:Chloride channel, core n=1 Tax=Cynara cardunculus var. scolymus TaxID=59895 RepID=A0A118JYX7_CYNCS|nr:Chloride channel, core [Cynara cardunculus var. scolymus]